jgi:Glycosyltransferase family 87
VTDRKATLVDAGLYAGSAVVAAGVWFLADIPIQRSWGRIAVGPYVGGAVVAVWLAFRGSPSTKARTWLAVAVLAGAALLPMALEVRWRSSTDPGLHAQSEVIITEEAARALLHGRDPYEVDYTNGPLRARPPGTRKHFPYLPEMVAFGLPRALGGSGPLGDARIAYVAVALLVLGLALMGDGRETPAERVRIFQIFAVVPTGALLMATGGDDLPVVALMLLAIVLAQRGRAGSSGLVLGLAAATKQTAWVLVPFLLLAARDGLGRPARGRASAAFGAVVLPVVLPFLLWHPAAFIEDVVKFPLGLGRQRSAAETPTLGSWVVRTFPSARGPMTVVLVGIVVAAAVVLVLRGRRTPTGAARSAGLVFLLAMVLTPAGRVGYLVYPVNLLAWSWLLGREDPAVAPGRDVFQPDELRLPGAAEGARPAR